MDRREKAVLYHKNAIDAWLHGGDRGSSGFSNSGNPSSNCKPNRQRSGLTWVSNSAYECDKSHLLNRSIGVKMPLHRSAEDPLFDTVILPENLGSKGRRRPPKRDRPSRR